MGSRLVAPMLIGLVVVVSVACRIEPRRKYDQRQTAEEKRQERLRLVRAQRSEFRDLQEQLASMKKEVNDHIKLYEMSTMSDDPLNRREDPIAHAAIVESARRLQEKSAAALAVDHEVFRYVKGSNRALRSYKAYAENVLAQYEQHDTPAETPTETP